MILRLSQRLNKKIKAGKLRDTPLDENPFADWSCHLFTAGRTQYIILTNTKSLYSCVMYGKGITDDKRLINGALSTIREFMEDDGHASAYERFIIPSSRTTVSGKALSRSVTGSITELIKFAQPWLVEDDISPHSLGFKLNGILLSPLGTEANYGYGKPRDAFKAMLDQRQS